jgi:hypothetical protein
MQRDRNTIKRDSKKREITRRLIVKGLLSITVLCLLGCVYGEEERTYCEKTKGEDIIAAGRGDECFSSRSISPGFYTTEKARAEENVNSLILYSSSDSNIVRALLDSASNQKPSDLLWEEWNGMEWNGTERNGIWKDSSYFLLVNDRIHRYRYVDNSFSIEKKWSSNFSYKRNVTDSSFVLGGYWDDKEDERGDEYRIKWGWTTYVKIRTENEGWPAHLDWENE